MCRCDHTRLKSCQQPLAEERIGWHIMLDRWTRSFQELPVTWGIVVLHIVLFWWVASVDPTFAPETLRKMGAHANPDVWKGEYYRLIVCGFLHGGLLHCLLNTMALVFLGRLLERLLGSVGFLSMYLFALLAGNIATLIWMSPLTVSVGASGAIMGLAGALFVLLLFDRDNRFLVSQASGRNLFFALILFQLLIGAVIPMINNAAHVGGFLAGACYGVFFWSRIPGVSLQRNTGTILMTAAVVVTLGLGVKGLQPKDTYAWHFYHGYSAFTNKEHKQFNQHASSAEAQLKLALKRDPKSKESWMYLGELYFQRRAFKKAEAAYGKLVKLEPNQFHYWFQWIHALAKSKQMKRAKQAFDEASKKFVPTGGMSGWTAAFWSPPEEQRELMRARLLAAIHREKEAILIYQDLLQRFPSNASLQNEYAWLLVTASNHKLRNAGIALDYAKMAVKESPNAAFLDTLGAAYFANGQWEKAVETETRAIHAPTSELSMPHIHFQLARFRRALCKHKPAACKPKPKARDRKAPTARKKASDAPVARKKANGKPAKKK